jgi:predicted AAA+ superfamily ATPase
MLEPGKVVCLLGARRTGKTVLIEHIKKNIGGRRTLFVQGDDLDVADVLSSPRAEVLNRFVRGYEYLFVDEAQNVPNIGRSIKLLVDTNPKIAVLLTGSASFDLRNKVGEPLVGRGFYMHLYPIAQLELSQKENMLETRRNLESRLIYGAYPQVITSGSDEEKRRHLVALRDGYLLKDILVLDNLKDSLFIFNLLRLLAFQIGQDVSFSELAANLHVNARTVRRYLELLEKTFVVFSLNGFSRNLRKEYTKSPRYYFWDNGIRNALISNFNPIHLRDDVGRLWENYCVVERMKRNAYREVGTNYFFWRTYDQKEIDLIEESQGELHGYEFKWGRAKPRTPKDFLTTYNGSSWRVIDQENYIDFIT